MKLYAVKTNDIAAFGRFTDRQWNVKNQPTPHGLTVFDDLVKRNGGQTELVLTHERLPPDEVARHTEGWTEILGELAIAVER